MVHNTLTVTGVYAQFYTRPPVIGSYTCVCNICGCWSVRIKISIRLKSGTNYNSIGGNGDVISGAYGGCNGHWHLWGYPLAIT